MPIYAHELHNNESLVIPKTAYTVVCFMGREHSKWVDAANKISMPLLLQFSGFYCGAVLYMVSVHRQRAGHASSSPQTDLIGFADNNPILSWLLSSCSLVLHSLELWVARSAS